MGNAVEHAFPPIVDRLNQVAGLTVHMAAINSDYWGHDMTVTGLLTGQDIAAQLAGKDLGDSVLLPALMLKQSDSQRPDETYFLDDMSVTQLENKLNCPVLSIAGLPELVAACRAAVVPQQGSGEDDPTRQMTLLKLSAQAQWFRGQFYDFLAVSGSFCKQVDE